MTNTININELQKNCEIISHKDIRFKPYGFGWTPCRYFNTAMRAFEGQTAVESIALECEIVIEGQSLDGIVMMHRDGRVYPMSRDTYDLLYE